MNFKFYINYLITLALFSCAPKMHSSIILERHPLTEQAYVLVLEENDKFPKEGEEVGIIKSTDNGFSTRCSYHEILDEFKEFARIHGANTVKITALKKPDIWSTCYRVTAKMYWLPEFSKYERFINWHPVRKLEWSDFKGVPKTASQRDVGAQTYCGIQYHSIIPNLISKPKIFVSTIFDCYASWVRNDQKDRTDLLAHERYHFNLCEVYARKLRYKFAIANFKLSDFRFEAEKIYQNTYKEYLSRQHEYDTQTRHGMNHFAQKQWQDTIDRELASWNDYAQ